MRALLFGISLLLLSGCADAMPSRAANSFLTQCAPQIGEEGYTIGASDGSLRLQFHDWVRIWIDSTPFVEAGVNLTLVEVDQQQDGAFFFEFKPQAYTALAKPQRMAQTFMQHNQSWLTYDETVNEYRLDWQDVALIWSADPARSACEVALSATWFEALQPAKPIEGWSVQDAWVRKAIKSEQP